MTLEELINASLKEGDDSVDFAQVIAELQRGRLTTQPNAKNNEQQLNPKLHDIMDPKKRPDKMVVVDKDSSDYGEVLNVNPNAEDTREGTRLEPVARIALAIQKLILKRAVSFTFGNPVKWNATPEGEQQEGVLKAIKRIFHDVKINTVNRKAARNIYGQTEVAEYWYPVDAEEHTLYGFPKKVKIKVALFSPAYGDTLYPYFDETRDLIAFSREFVRKGTDLIERTYFETYTKDAHYLWSCDNKQDGSSDNQWKLVEGYPKKNPIGKIPIVYGYQPQVEWADVQTLIDRLEKLLSNFADTNDYHASPKIFVEGTIKGFARKGEAGGIIEGEEGAKAQYLSWANAPESVKLEIETLLKMIYTITQTPDISFDTVKGIGSISGVALKLLFMDAHLKVQDKNEIFSDFLQRRVNIILAYIKMLNVAWAEAADELIVEPEITPYIITDEQSELNILSTANGGKAVASQKTTIERLGWTDDTDAELEQIAKEDEASSTFLQGEPTI